MSVPRLPGASRRVLIAAAASLPLATRVASAQPARWRPRGPVRVIVGAAPGGTLDIHARASAPILSRVLGQAVLVENQGGASGRIAAQLVARAEPDGHTILVGSGDGLVLSDILFGAAQGRLLPLLRPVTLTIAASQLLVTHTGSGLRTVQDYVAAIRSRGEGFSLAVPGHGGIAHVISEVLNRRLGGVRVTHVTYRGGGPATVDLLAGVTDAMIITLPAVTTHVRAGRLVPLAVSTRERDPAIPEAPSFHETVAPGFDVPSTQGALLPAATPDEAVAAWHGAWQAALLDATVNRRLSDLGFIVTAAANHAFQASLDSSAQAFAEAIAAAGIRVEAG
jgi:tripartite-type tricarboxylate transporter receptor subunit TctC